MTKKIMTVDGPNHLNGSYPAFYHVISPLKALMYTQAGNEVTRNVYMKIEVKRMDGSKRNNARLSISGVEGPLVNGDALGSCGQIYKPLEEYERFKFNKGWDADLYNRFVSIWERWHLNEMNPGCLHQRAAGCVEKSRKEVKIYKFRMLTEILEKQSDLKAHIRSELLISGKVELSEAEKYLLALEYSFKSHKKKQDRKSYTLDEEDTQTKTLNWLDESEHPDGWMGRECVECGYKYGSSWNHEELPCYVYNFLRDLPDSVTKPAWV